MERNPGILKHILIFIFIFIKILILIFIFICIFYSLLLSWHALYPQVLEDADDVGEDEDPEDGGEETDVQQPHADAGRTVVRYTPSQILLHMETSQQNKSYIIVLPPTHPTPCGLETKINTKKFIVMMHNLFKNKR